MTTATREPQRAGALAARLQAILAAKGIDPDTAPAGPTVEPVTALELADRRIPPRYREALATQPEVLGWVEAVTGAGRNGPAGTRGIAYGPSLLIAGTTGIGKTHQAWSRPLAAGRRSTPALAGGHLRRPLRPAPAPAQPRPRAGDPRARPVPAADPGRPRRGQAVRVDRGADVPADQPPLHRDAPDPDHHQPAHRGTPQRSRGPRRLPSGRDDHPRHPHRPRPPTRPAVRLLTTTVPLRSVPVIVGDRTTGPSRSGTVPIQVPSPPQSRSPNPVPSRSRSRSPSQSRSPSRSRPRLAAASPKRGPTAVERGPSP